MSYVGALERSTVQVFVVLTMACWITAVRPAVSPGQVWGCPGDCNGDATVTVDELLTVIAVMFGEVPRDGQCVGPADANRDGRVRIDDAVRALRRSMLGCPPMGWCVGVSTCRVELPRPDATHEFCCYYSTATERSDRIVWCSELPDYGGCACNSACDGCRVVQRPTWPPDIVCDDMVGAGP
jgi:hypothetical protein